MSTSLARSFVRRTARPTRPNGSTHRFLVGQTVRLRGSFGASRTTAEIYHVTGTLPPIGVSPQYRIRNDDERHERVTTEDRLEPASLSPGGEGATLIERTFGSTPSAGLREGHHRERP
jgi:hypothetical protein